MKVYEYFPLYNCYQWFEDSRLSIIENSSGEKEIHLPGKTTICINELFENYSELNLNEVIIEEMEFYDRIGLSNALNSEYFTSETVIPFLREMFDDYKSKGGSPMYWLNETLWHVINNYQHFKTEYSLNNS